MQIGILFEGDRDERPIKRIVKRIAQSVCPGHGIVIIPFVADGPIEAKISAAATEFFFNKESDLAVFVADADRDRSKRNKLMNKVRSLDTNTKPVIVACPDPELEEWFFQEEAAVKNIFKLHGDQPIPYSNLPPKERIEKLFRESNVIDITETVSDIYEKVALQMNFDTMADKRRSPSFQIFYENFESELKRYCTSNPK